MPKKRQQLTAAELMDRLQGDPDWVRQNAEREARRERAVAQLQAELKPEQTPLLAELAEVGCLVTSVWDLVNTAAPYPAAVPVLTKYLRVTRHPVLREGIARALTVREARGIAGRELLQELAAQKDPPCSEVRWALANALTVAADKSMIDEINEMAADPRYVDVHERLTATLKKLRAK